MQQDAGSMSSTWNSLLMLRYVLPKRKLKKNITKAFIICTFHSIIATVIKYRRMTSAGNAARN